MTADDCLGGAEGITPLKQAERLHERQAVWHASAACGLRPRAVMQVMIDKRRPRHVIHRRARADHSCFPKSSTSRAISCSKSGGTCSGVSCRSQQPGPPVRSANHSGISSACSAARPGIVRALQLMQTRSRPSSAQECEQSSLMCTFAGGPRSCPSRSRPVSFR